MSISSSLLFWPALVLASATCGVPVIVLARADAPKQSHATKPPPKTCHASSSQKSWQTQAKPKPPEHHAVYRLDYAITTAEETGSSLSSGRFDIADNHPLEVGMNGPSVIIKGINDKAPVSRMTGPGYKLKMSAHDGQDGRVLVDIVYEEATPNGGRVNLRTSAIAKPGEPEVARLDWPGGGRDIQFKLERAGMM